MKLNGAVGLRLARINAKEELILCDSVRFDGGTPAVQMVLNRAKISGRVQVNGKIENHFADALDENEDIVQTIALDRKSYAALKNKWMRCKVQRAVSSGPGDAQRTEER